VEDLPVPGSARRITLAPRNESRRAALGVLRRDAAIHPHWLGHKRLHGEGSCGVAGTGLSGCSD
jgi:hypothetical protein